MKKMPISPSKSLYRGATLGSGWYEDDPSVIGNYASKYDPPIKVDEEEYYKMYPICRCKDEPIL
jgi:hypothetical protein